MKTQTDIARIVNCFIASMRELRTVVLRTNRRAADNRRLAKKRVQWLNEHSTSYQILCWFDTLVLRNPLLRQAPKR